MTMRAVVDDTCGLRTQNRKIRPPRNNRPGTRRRGFTVTQTLRAEQGSFVISAGGQLLGTCLTGSVDLVGET